MDQVNLIPSTPHTQTLFIKTSFRNGSGKPSGLSPCEICPHSVRWQKVLTVEWQQLFFIDLYLTGQSRRTKLHRMLFRGYYQLMTLLEFPCFNLWNFIFLFFQDGVHIFVHVHYRFCNAGHSRNSANCEYTFPLPVNTRSNN